MFSTTTTTISSKLFRRLFQFQTQYYSTSLSSVIFLKSFQKKPLVFPSIHKTTFPIRNQSIRFFTSSNDENQSNNENKSNSEKDEISKIIEKATNLAHSEKQKEGLQLLESEVFEKGSTDYRILDLLSQIYLGSENYEECRRVCQLEKEPSATLLSRIGESYERQGKIKEAVEFYQKTLNIDPLHELTCLRWGHLALQASSKNTEDKNEYLNLAEDLFSLPFPKNPPSPMKEELLYGYSQVLYEKKDYEKIINVLPSKLESFSEVFAPLYHLLGESRRRLGKYEEAISDYEVFLSEYPQYVKKRYGDILYADQVMANIMLKRGICLYNVGKYSESIEQMDQLIKVGKHFMSEAYCYKAMCYEKSSKWDDVITFASKSIQLNPNLLESFQVRAKAYEMVSLHDLAEHDRDRYQYLERKSLYNLKKE